MKKCPKCQFELPDEATFCTECGEKIELDSLKCKDCLRISKPNSKFCMHCGSKNLEVYKPATMDDWMKFFTELNQ